MLKESFFDEIAQKFSELIKASPSKDLKQNIQALLSNAFSKMQLVTREEFDVQQAVLKRTREELQAMREQIAQLEAQSKATENEASR